MEKESKSLAVNLYSSSLPVTADPMLFDQLNRLVSIDQFQVHIAQTFLLEEAAPAQPAMKKHYLGKIVLRVSGE